MRTRTTLSLALLLSGLAAVSRPGSGDSGDDIESLMEADRRFARETAARGADGWADTFQEDAIMFPARGRVDGREAIRERMKGAFTPGNPRLVWEPAEAWVAGSSDLGYTVGRWQSVGKDSAGGDSTLAEGNYVTIWRRDGDGEWRVALDIGNSDPD